MKVNPQVPRISPYWVMAVGILAISTGAVLTRNAQTQAPSLVIASWRLGLATLILTPFALSRNRQEIRSIRGRDRLFISLAGLFLALHFATWITSLEYTTVASSVVFVNTTPLWVALLSPFILKESITRTVMIGMILALIGGLVIALNDICIISYSTLICPPLSELFRGRAFIGDLLAICGAIMLALYVMMGRKLRSNYSLVGYIFVVYGLAAIVLIGLALLNREQLVGYSPQTYLWLLLIALFPQLLGHSSFNWSLKYVSAAIVSTVLLCEPIGSTILAIVFLHEIPSVVKIFGAILILMGIFIAIRPVPYKEITPAIT